MVKKITEQIPKRRRESRLLAAATALALSVLTVGDIPAVYAVDGDEGAAETVYYASDVIETQTSGYVSPISFFSLSDGTVELASGNAEKWIDRLSFDSSCSADLIAFYNSLVEWTDNDGTDDYLIEDASSEIVSLTMTTGETYNCIKLFATTANSTYVQNALRAVYDAFDRDHPEVFWLSGQTQFVWTTPDQGVTNTYYIALTGSNGYSIKSSDYTTASQIQADISARDSNVNTIMSGLSGSETVYEKVKYFDNWLTTHNEYNTLVANNQSGAPGSAWECISALEGKIGTEGPVCEGYSRAMKLLCDKASIPCVLVDGTANGGAHMWNNIQVDGSWYVTDVTWDDPTGGTSGAVSGVECTDYLLKGSDNSIFSNRTTANCASDGGVQFTNEPVPSTSDYTPSAVKTVISIAVKTKPSKMEYEIGDRFDPTGLVITVSYSDSSTDDVTYSTVNKDDFTFDPEPFNSAGAQTVTVTYGGKSATISGITVNKKTPTADDFTFTAPESTEYDGTAKEATVKANTGVSGMGTVTVYYCYGSNTPTTTAPTDAGTYTVKINVDEGATYSAANDITASGWTFTIDPFDISKCSVTLSPTEFTYNGSKQEPDIEVMHGENELSGSSDYSYNTDGPPGNGAAGDYTITIEGTGNYTGMIEKTYTINPATPVLEDSVTVSSGTVYNSTSVDDVTLSGTFKGVGAYLTKTIDGTLKFADTVTEFTVGTKNYDWVFTHDDPNYTTATGTVEITVLEDKPSSIEVTPPTKTSYTAGETFDPAGLAVKVIYASGADKSVTYSEATKGSFSFENTSMTYGTDGKQKVTVNYKEGTTTVSKDIEVTVSKAAPTVSAPTGLTATYGDTLGSVTLPSPDNGTWAWEGASQSVGNVGTNTFSATFTPDDTDYLSVTKEVSVTVSPKEITPTGATADNKDYDGTTTAKVSVTFDGLVSGVSFSLGTDYTAEGVFDNANAGTGKTVTVTVTLGNSELAKNYTLTSDTCTTTADINKINPTVTVPTTLTCSYKEGETPSLSNVALPAGWTWDNSAQPLNDGDNDCNATYTPADKTNYNKLHKTVTVNVVKTECTHVNTTTTYSPEDAKCGDTVTATVTCSDCGNVLSVTTTVMEHTWAASYTTVTEPDCTTPGMKHIVCTKCGAEKPGSETVIAALGHTGGEADCTHSAVCTRCGAEYGSPLGHSWSEGYSSDKNGHWQTCTRCGASSEVQSHVSGGAATATTPETCIVCGYEIAPAAGSGSSTDTPEPTPIIPAPTPTPSPTPGHDPSSPAGSGTGSGQSSASGPSVSGSGQKGWDSVSEAIADTPEGGTVTVDMNGSTALPKSVLNEIAGRDIDLVLKLNNGFVWSISGKDISEPKNISLGAKMNTDNIPDSAIDSISEGNKTIQFSLKYSGDFGFTTSISVPMGAKYNGKTANLFYYNPKTKSLEYVSCAAISGGKAELDFSHASDWAIVITDEPMYTAEDVTAGAGIYESSESVIPGAGSTAVIAVILPVIAAAAFILRKKLSK